MKRLLGLSGVIMCAACRVPQPASTPTPTIVVQDQSKLDPAAQARADRGIPPFNDADLRFVSGMIHHHAQAILISKWAPSHGASDAVQKLCERIVVAQRDEIRMLSNWLRTRGQTVPVADTLGTMTSSMHSMPGMDMPMSGSPMMPGMLTPTQVAQLDSARGKQFDRLFLMDMIQHHQGAITMVHELFASPGAAEDGVISRFAADVEADQGAEIERMTRMLEAISK